MRKITVEELDIVVQASVEQALTEFKKIVPQLKKTIQQVENGLNNVDTKGMTNKVQQAVQQVKQKIHEVKNTGVDKQLQAQFNKAGASVQKYEVQLDQLNQKLRKVYAEMDNIQANTWKEYTPEGVELGNKAIEPTVSNALSDNKQYQSLTKQAAKLEEQIVSLNAKLNTTKQQYGQIAGQIQEVVGKQNIWSNAINKVRSSLSSLKGSADNVRKSFNQLPNITTKVNAKITQIGKGMKQGLGHVLRYAGALFSLESIYTMLSSSANAWLSSQNAQAQQLNANIEYMKYAMGSALAPIIQFVTNLVYKLMKAIQSVAYALTGVNIFANASADAYSNMASSASDANKATKQLAGVHSEINNISSNDSSAGGGSGGNVAPSIDLSEVDTSMVSWIDKIKERLSTLFEPIRNSWDNYGQALMDSIKYAFESNLELIKTIGKSFEKVWLNGTGEQTCSTILQILTSIFNTCGNINKAFKEAWENNGGTEIIQNLWDGLNNILGIIQGIFKVFENWTSSESFQVFADSIIQIFNTLSSWFEIITQKLKEIWDNGGSYALNSLLEVISKIVEFVSVILDILSPVVEFILNIVTPIISGIVQTIGFLMDALGGLLDFIIGVFTGDWERAWQGICDFFTGIWNALKTIVETVWNAICSFLSAIWEAIKGIATTVWTAISNFFSSIWNGIKNVATTIWNAISTFFSNIWNGIKNVAMTVWNAITTTISNVINGIKNTISNVLNTIKTVWNNIWNGVKNTVVNIWNGIWGAIKSVINAILSGIEGFVNGIIRGINWVLGGISNVANAVGSLIGLDPINLRINTISLPRLAKGAVLKVPTVAEMAEYPGASTNPEIVTPQNIMEETFDRVLARYQNEDTTPIYLTVNVGNTKLGQILLDDLRKMKRRSGKEIEALVGG